MKNPYLVQRAKFEDNRNKKGIDSVLRLDYMGSAEFEFGALPESGIVFLAVRKFHK